MKSLNVLFLLLVSSFLFTSCEDDEVVAPKTAVDVVVENSNFTLLEAAVLHAGLAEALASPTITVFAPTDDAFKAAGFANAAAIQAADKNLIASILTYHVVGSLVPASAIETKNNAEVTTLNTAKVYVTKNAGGVSVNGAKVTTADVKAENGAIIHIIDAVLIPESRNIVALAQANPNLSLLVAAVLRANQGATKVVDILSGQDIYTVFAPTNDAFIAAGFPTAAAIQAAPPDVLASILTYHVIPGRVYSTNLVTGNVATANGGNIAVNAANATLKGNANAGNTKIIGANIPASNGVVHLIDSVLLP
ncbi:MAG TPA: fasciclin domain-containing protein [Saprospiraceae bacterium]|nr:fasciclin domain-containing protein [Saprospiraceae bacterium]